MLINADTSELKKAGSSLRASEERIRKLLELMQDEMDELGTAWQGSDGDMLCRSWKMDIGSGLAHLPELLTGFASALEYAAEQYSKLQSGAVNGMFV